MTDQAVTTNGRQPPGGLPCGLSAETAKVVADSAFAKSAVDSLVGLRPPKPPCGTGEM